MLLEFSLILFLLVAIAFGILDLGRIFNASVILTNAAREGARYGTRNPDNSAGVVTAAQNEAASSGLTISSTQITSVCPDLNADGSCDPGYPIRVTITFPFDMILGELFSVSPITLQRSAEMMVP